jgi:hypothetical protein
MPLNFCINAGDLIGGRVRPNERQKCKRFHFGRYVVSVRLNAKVGKDKRFRFSNAQNGNVFCGAQVFIAPFFDFSGPNTVHGVAPASFRAWARSSPMT